MCICVCVHVKKMYFYSQDVMSVMSVQMMHVNTIDWQKHLEVVRDKLGRIVFVLSMFVGFNV